MGREVGFLVNCSNSVTFVFSQYVIMFFQNISHVALCMKYISLLSPSICYVDNNLDLLCMKYIISNAWGLMLGNFLKFSVKIKNW